MEEIFSDYECLIKFLWFYHSSTTIPAFKRDKRRQYLTSLNNFGVKEIYKSQREAKLLHGLLDCEERTQEKVLDEKDEKVIDK